MNYFKQLNIILNSKQKRSFIYLSFLMFLSMSFEILTLYSLLILLNTFSDPTSISDSQILIFIQNLNFHQDLYFKILIIFLIIFLIKTLVIIFIHWKENKYIFLTRAELSQEYFKGYLYLPRLFHLRTNISETIKNITTEIEALIAAIHACAIILMESIVLVGLVVFLLFVNYKIALFSFFSLLIFSYIISYFNSKKILAMGKERVKFFQLRLKYIMEGLSGSKIFALTGSQKKVMADFNNYNFKIANISTSVGFRNNLPRPLFELFILLIVVLFFFFVTKNNSDIKDIVPTLGVFLSAAYRLAPSFGRIMSNLQRFQFNIPSADKLSRDKLKFLTQEQKNEKVKKIIFNNNIIFKNINFSYSKNLKKDENFVIKNLNCEIKKASKIGIMGESGSGKSTFLDILMGLMDPQNGEILIDGKNIKDIRNSWQKIIGCVPQEVFIIDASLKKNIAFGLPDEEIDIKKINQSIEAANLSNLVKNLSFGIDSIVGEKGSRISGGQRQRIGIARALYNDPNILVFDEATNALDVQTEKSVINEIFTLGKDKTIIFVSHNLENLRFCENIFEIKDRTLSKIN